jgi:UDP-2,3-diacylglucosamine pyrophosphatase LpxH
MHVGMSKPQQLFSRTSSNFRLMFALRSHTCFHSSANPPSGTTMADAIVISDLHLGSDNCQAEQLVHFLEQFHVGQRSTQHLILNGDVFDSMDFRRLKKWHWRVLSQIRKLSDHVKITWIIGNHDGPADIVSHLLGVELADEYELVSGGKRMLFLHGHQFDEFTNHYPITGWFADWVYRCLQKLDKSHEFAKWAKHKSKTFLRCSDKIEYDAVEYARTRGVDVVCCGHTHFPLEKQHGDVKYFNSGCWTEKPCHYLQIEDGRVQVRAAVDELPVGKAEYEVPLAVPA